ncbi:uncharacterized protein LOC117647285 [Thrips palmi]|uniref:Uncharacterized protein LOC117647285 n=1 Tax=Thrips palmi TaxID=161013 RepID=A0A6P8Z501_THRPL|nr:uncharacterized protein LOC117647285 [Thrips palmi]
MCSGSSPVMAANFTNVERVVAVVVVLVGCLLCLQQGALAAPPYEFLQPADKPPTVFAADNACYHDAEVETLCQRCAKTTKSPVVFPMCCNDKEEAREWCKRYLEFGVGAPATS